ncbi:hypothetical protein OG21DRAFT_1524585 [Imleria badia]|nr:hypothetical protein OG21DRAFT_1524585 [Imleria badia]
MREFHNTGWQYYDHFVQILPAGASSGVRTHRGTGRKTAMTANSTDSSDSQSLATASSAPPYDLLRGDLPMAGSESVTLANTSSKLHAFFPVPQSTSPTGTTAVESSSLSGKRPHSMISPDIIDPSNPSLLSLLVPLPPSSTTPSQVPTKHSRTLACAKMDEK